MKPVFDANSPIGVLDSGIGGFSVARAVQRLLPAEQLIYFGDGAHIPYGNHPEDKIVAMARYMFSFLEQRRVKALLVACNTISCVIDRCADAVSCPTFNAVQAGADAVSRLDVDRVGVISTVFTHNSRCYPQRILAQSPKKLVVLSCGCPDLARLVEHNLGDPGGMAAVEADLHQELDHMVYDDHIQCCVLGCTHYPLVADSIRCIPVCPSSTRRRRWPRSCVPISPGQICCGTKICPGGWTCSPRATWTNTPCGPARWAWTR